jgi:hypothetical protein
MKIAANEKDYDSDPDSDYNPEIRFERPKPGSFWEMLKCLLIRPLRVRYPEN